VRCGIDAQMIQGWIYEMLWIGCAVPDQLPGAVENGTDLRLDLRDGTASETKMYD
jgi:hypothetical protein